MKNIAYIILGIIIGALATYFFCPRQMENGDIKIVKPKGVITVEKAWELDDNWTEFRQAAVDSAAKKQGRDKDNRWTHWSLDDIENYLAFAKHQSDSLGYKMTGIRVYLGVYGKNADVSKKDLTTMFMVPTGKKARAGANSFFSSAVGNEEDVPGGSPLNEGSGGKEGYNN
ncbi:hypothetical protein [Mariniflexile sp.]|uniref:hypothetical protein n=1 Tax=Mariniflexile sp. TaxID=1979402 RepID=UPI00404787BF